MLRNEQQPRLELNLKDPLYHVTSFVASVHLNLDSDSIYGCTDEPPTLVLGWTLSLTIVDHVYMTNPGLIIKKKKWKEKDRVRCITKLTTLPRSAVMAVGRALISSVLLLSFSLLAPSPLTFFPPSSSRMLKCSTEINLTRISTHTRLISI